MSKIFTVQNGAISVNKMRKGRTFLTKEYKETKDAMALELAYQKHVTRKDKDLTVMVTFYLKELYRKDIDGGIKMVLDAGTEAGLWLDDRNITCLIVKKVKAEKDYVEIEILN